MPPAQQDNDLNVDNVFTSIKTIGTGIGDALITPLPSKLDYMYLSLELSSSE